MIKRFLPLVLASLCAPLFGNDFKVDDVIHPVVAKLGEPVLDPDFSKGQMAISSSSEAASAHVVQGIARLNASWDFEAYRHFCFAAKKDPDCMMAYWGIALSLAGSEHEFYQQREIAVDRMLDLLEAGQGVEIERAYVEAAGRLVTGSVSDAGLIFEAVSKKFPMDVQSKLFTLFFQRDGFDSFGDARPGQVRAGKGLRALVEEFPENLSVLSFWVSSQAEAPLDSQMLREEVLPYARKLVRLKPDYPPFSLMLAHVEARCGNARLAIESCLNGIAQFEGYLAKEKVSIFDCDGLVRAKVYLASLLASKGQYEQSLVVSQELAAMKIPVERMFSPGAGMLLWEGRTIGARLAMARSTKAELEAGQKILDIQPEEQWFKEKSFVLEYRDCLAFYLGVRKAILAKDLVAARALYEQLLARAKVFEGKQALAVKTSSYSHWLRAVNALSVATTELRGMIAEEETGAMKMAAISWYQSAADRQSRPTNLLPPAIDYPMELRLGNYYLLVGNFESAAKAFRKGLIIRPNHLQTLEGFQKALSKQGRKDDAELMAQRIREVKD